jgi:hypothetical protein
MDGLQEKYKLFSKLGALFGPLQRLIEHPEQYNEQEKARAIARYCNEYPRLKDEFSTFSESQPGHKYSIQESKFRGALVSVETSLTFFNEELKDVVPVAISRAQSAINAIPIPSTSVILEAGSPFTAYCRLRELCEIDATTSLVWLDPYFDESIFHRYLLGIRSETIVTLVTREPKAHASNREKRRWTEFLDISRLYAQERGSTAYQLILQPSLHDRWIVFDEKRIYSLGGSAKDAGSRDYFTITSIESNLTNLEIIQNQVASGTEIFGSINSPHP